MAKALTGFGVGGSTPLKSVGARERFESSLQQKKVFKNLLTNDQEYDTIRMSKGGDANGLSWLVERKPRKKTSRAFTQPRRMSEIRMSKGVDANGLSKVVGR